MALVGFPAGEEAIGAPGLTALVKLLKEGKAVERSQAGQVQRRLGDPRILKLGPVESHQMACRSAHV